MYRAPPHAQACSQPPPSTPGPGVAHPAVPPLRDVPKQHPSFVPLRLHVARQQQRAERAGGRRRGCRRCCEGWCSCRWGCCTGSRQRHKAAAVDGSRGPRDVNHHLPVCSTPHAAGAVACNGAAGLIQVSRGDSAGAAASGAGNDAWAANVLWRKHLMPSPRVHAPAMNPQHLTRRRGQQLATGREGDRGDQAPVAAQLVVAGAVGDAPHRHLSLAATAGKQGTAGAPCQAADTAAAQLAHHRACLRHRVALPPAGASCQPPQPRGAVQRGAGQQGAAGAPGQAGDSVCVPHQLLQRGARAAAEQPHCAVGPGGGYQAGEQGAERDRLQ